MTFSLKNCVAASALATLALVSAAGAAEAQAQKPNILVIMGDDIGYWNISAYSRGMMGYRTPNIDRIANEGAIFTDYYAQQSCTAGRAAFITGQSPIRTGLTKVGLPRRRKASRTRTRPWPNCSSPRATPPASSARTISATATNSCRPSTASTSSSATSITSTRRKSRRTSTIRRPQSSGLRKNFGPRGVLKCVATATETPGDVRASGPGASRNARTPARSPRSGWRRWTRSSSRLARLHRPRQ